MSYYKIYNNKVNQEAVPDIHYTGLAKNIHSGFSTQLQYNYTIIENPEWNSWPAQYLKKDNAYLKVPNSKTINVK